VAACRRPSEPEVIRARPERAGRGPRPDHTRARLAAAVRIADAEGLDGVSTRRVAAGIGCGTMSLHGYVPRKEELHELMADAVVAAYALPEAPSGEWRAGLKELCRQGRAVMLRHPWLPPADVARLRVQSERPALLRVRAVGDGRAGGR
jgi:AcrR family transcriptional regulator